MIEINIKCDEKDIHKVRDELHFALNGCDAYIESDIILNDTDGIKLFLAPDNGKIVKLNGEKRK